MKFRRKRELSPTAQTAYALVQELKEKVIALKQLPNDFRDIEVGSPKWRLYYDLMPGSREIMTEWSRGPILHIGSINGMERYLLGQSREFLEVIPYCRTKEDQVEGASSYEIEWLVKTARGADNQGYCLMYMPTYIVTVVDGLNKLFAFGGWNLRARSCIRDERGLRVTERGVMR